MDLYQWIGSKRIIENIKTTNNYSTRYLGDSIKYVIVCKLLLADNKIMK